MPAATHLILICNQGVTSSNLVAGTIIYQPDTGPNKSGLAPNPSPISCATRTAFDSAHKSCWANRLF